MKLLIVEDNAAMRRLIRDFVRKQTESVFECEDGVGALNAYNEHRPDWVLMDIEMPQTDGISATRQIIAAFPEARIVIVTDHDNRNLRQAAQEAGACQFIVKDNLVELCLLLAR